MRTADTKSPMGCLTAALDAMRIAQHEITVGICMEHFGPNRSLVKVQAAKAASELQIAVKRLRALSNKEGVL